VIWVIDFLLQHVAPTGLISEDTVSEVVDLLLRAEFDPMLFETDPRLILSSHSKFETRLLMIGLEDSGKTTILYKLKLGTTEITIPTVGFNVENVEIRGANFTVWCVHPINEA
jgi:hypothetical protein